MKLPEPVKAVCVMVSHVGSTHMTPKDSYFTAAQMIAFRNAALEEAAQHCERVIDELQITDDISEKIYLDGVDCAEEIRALKVKQ